ncbi:NAD(P)-dependent oxidoreductase [Arthrobacter sp. N199823]|uniref:NAD-dependent epimerase/dehydratase family protein n=1 Tax=Arthrobacter sp. N199823 TaxID=2058895 RepID=UPI000CE3086D|nr:NAD-dependent epimerase/dehydratase family protein [Arthrobacter sp. N199823]
MSTEPAELRWLVLGASGFVGSAIVEELMQRGATVVSMAAPRLRSAALSGSAPQSAQLAQSPQSAQLSQPEQQIVAEAEADAAGSAIVECREALRTAFAGFDVVVNAAGLATPGDGESQELTGANALLPTVAALAAKDAGVRRFVHLSSASVQGHRRVIDESADRAPFSAYSRSKALGEQALELVASQLAPLSLVTVRATSVQGPSRPTTQSLIKVASSPIASVAAPGTYATPVSSIDALAWFVVETGQYAEQVPAVILQPWEGLSVSDVLAAAGGRVPRRLPQFLCRWILSAGYFSSRLLGEKLHGPLRRVELMWFGQEQTPGWAASVGLIPHSSIATLLERAREQK